MFGASLSFVVSANRDFVEVRIDPRTKEMNVVEGVIKFSGPTVEDLLVQVENGESILPIWPVSPQFDKENKSISFVGGVPNGFKSEGLLFRLRLQSSKSGNLTISYVNGNGYLNDGKGTKEEVISQPLKIYLDENDLGKINEDSSSLNKNNYAIIILLTVIILFVILRYVFKKYYKK